jgi:hypothetical protein
VPAASAGAAEGGATPDINKRASIEAGGPCKRVSHQCCSAWVAVAWRAMQAASSAPAEVLVIGDPSMAPWCRLLRPAQGLATLGRGRNSSQRMTLQCGGMIAESLASRLRWVHREMNA